MSARPGILVFACSDFLVFGAKYKLSHLLTYLHETKQNINKERTKKTDDQKSEQIESLQQLLQISDSSCRMSRHSTIIALWWCAACISQRCPMYIHHLVWCAAIWTLASQLSWAELSPDICMRRRTRCSVTTVPDDGSRMLEKLSLQQAFEGAQRQFGGS